jgi:WD40 repeat protein
LVTASESEIAVWDCSDGRRIAADDASEGRNFVKAFGNMVVTGNQGRIEFRDCRTLQLVRTFNRQRDQSDRFGFSNVGDVSLSPSGRRMVSGAWNNTLTIWDVENGLALLTLAAHSGGVHHVSFSSNGRSIVSAGHDGTVRAWHSTEPE